MTLSAHQLTVRVRGKATPIIENVSLDVSPGEFVAIIGANGAGKSTILKALSGDMTPDHGQVVMNGRPLSQWRMKDRARVRAVLPQSSVLNAPFTALEIVLMGRAPHIRGIEHPRDYEIAREALTAAHVDHLEARSYTTLSGGERQRVQLARVLAQIWEPVEGNAQYLLIDEPTNNLDIAHQHSTLRIARRFAGEGVGVLAILHDLNLASQYADRVVIVNQGHIVAEGSAEAVFTPETIQQAFHISVTITTHPHLERPLIVPIPEIAELTTDDLDEQLHLVRS